jgi:hypothetical protein
MKTDTSIAVLFIGIVLASALSGTVTAAGNMAFQEVSARCTGVNRAVAVGESWLSLDMGPFEITSAFNASATAIFPKGILEGPWTFSNVNVSFLITIPDDTYLEFLTVTAEFISSDNHHFASGDSEGEFFLCVINRTGSWNTTVRIYPDTYPLLPIPQNQSGLLPFTSQKETSLYVGLAGFGGMSVNGTQYLYQFSTWFHFQDFQTTFYRFSYPSTALLGYDISILIVVASVCLLLYTVWRQRHKQRS